MADKFKFNPTTGKLDLVSVEDLSGYVPYTGATTNVDLGNNTLKAGGTQTGQSKIASGMVVNENGGGLSSDSFRAETVSEPNAFEVDAVLNEVRSKVSSKFGSATNNTNILPSGRLSYVGSARKQWTKYTADTITLTNGTSANTVANLRSMTDGLYYNIQEAATTPGINLIVDFISVTAFERCRVLAQYEGSSTHSLALQLYNWTTSAWDTFNSLENGIADITTAGGIILHNYEFTCYDDTNYIGTSANLGKVRVRFYHTMAGNASHDLHIDEVSLRQ